MDRLGWADGFSFTSYGARIGIRTNEPDVLCRIQQSLPPKSRVTEEPVVDTLFSVHIGGISRRAGVRRFNMLYEGAGRVARSMETDEILEALESSLHLSVAMWARRRLFVHAGVVAYNGKAIVIPGRSMSGKSTLVAELVRQGAVYYSDEYAVFDSAGKVYPYVKPLGHRAPGEIHQTSYTVDSIGGSAGKRPLHVGLIALTSFREGARFRPRAMSPGQAALALIDNTVMARFRTRAAMSTFANVVPSTISLKGTRGEAPEAARRLIDELNRFITS